MRAELRIDELMQEKSRQEGKRISIYGIAKTTGFSQKCVRAYIYDTNTRFDAYVLAGLAQYFDCSIGELFKPKKPNYSLSWA